MGQVLAPSLEAEAALNPRGVDYFLQVGPTPLLYSLNTPEILPHIDTPMCPLSSSCLKRKLQRWCVKA